MAQTKLGEVNADVCRSYGDDPLGLWGETDPTSCFLGGCGLLKTVSSGAAKVNIMLMLFALLAGVRV